MARRKGSRGFSTNTTATPRVRTLSPSFSVTPTNWRQFLTPQPRVSLQEVEDRRLFHPLGRFAPPKTVAGTPARLTVKDRPPTAKQLASPFMRKVRSQTKAVLTFADPERTVMCIRRKERREVLHALGRTGSGNRRPKRNAWSSISCR